MVFMLPDLSLYLDNWDDQYMQQQVIMTFKISSPYKTPTGLLCLSSFSAVVTLT